MVQKKTLKPTLTYFEIFHRDSDFDHMHGIKRCLTERGVGGCNTLKWILKNQSN